MGHALGTMTVGIEVVSVVLAGLVAVNLVLVGALINSVRQDRRRDPKSRQGS